MHEHGPSRLADLLSALSLATDLGVGVPLETSLRACAVATGLGARLGLSGPSLRVVYYAALLRHLGCTAWSHEAAALIGDDHDLIRTFEGVDPARRSEVAAHAVRIARGAPLGSRIRAVARVMTRPGEASRLAAAQCAQAEALASDLGLPAEVSTALAQIYERYDGRGVPRGLQGDEVTVAAGLVQAAHLAEVLHRLRGREAAVEGLRRQRGRQLAPEICEVAVAEAEAMWASLEAQAVVERVLDAEPEPRLDLPPERIAEVALAFARFTDLKTPHSLGHSTAVATLAAAAAGHAGWPRDEVERLRAAALLHDLGAVSVSNQIWECPGPLGAAAWEQVRLHAYYTERILMRTPATGPLAAIAGAHHERLDGSGYHRALRGDGIARSARLLSAADAFVALGEQRPYRPAHETKAREQLLSVEVQAGRLCRSAVGLVLAATGGTAARLALPAGLTDREADVLALLARGLANKEIAAALGIALRTVKHHIEHVYDKTGVSSRAAAALFAVRHDLVPQPDRSSDP